MKHRITRKHEFCAGHRIHGHEGRCARLHGHNYVVRFICEADALDALGRVVDFSVIKATLCQWLEDHWDHVFLVWDADPIAARLREIDETVLPVPFNPTAENMARYLVETVGPQALAGTGVRLVGAEIDETGKCSAYYGIQ
jgi:6-pyruvoyltetrahydropterin/6-carboxytetrahydropterin synthase